MTSNNTFQVACSGRDEIPATHIRNCASGHGSPTTYVSKLWSMGVKYYTHFIAQEDGAVDYEEYRGVVELFGQTPNFGGDREIAQVLAQSFDLEEDDIQVLQWQQLH